MTVIDGTFDGKSIHLTGTPPFDEPCKVAVTFFLSPLHKAEESGGADGKSEFSALCGSWTAEDYQEFTDKTRDFSRIDKADWQ
jgi:hypothetical protein